MDSVVLENQAFRLTLSSFGMAESLVLKKSGTECLFRDDPLPFFTLTEDRPYNNELKLAHPHKRTTYAANRIRYEGGRLIVGFEQIALEAVVEVTVKPSYMVFTPVDFLAGPKAFGLGVSPMLPPVAAFRLVQLPLIPRDRFGEWLNVLWDQTVAVNVLSTCPTPCVGEEDRRGCKVLYGETLRETGLKQGGVALIVADPKDLLDVIDGLEIDYDLPRGVQSRRSPLINRSYYWAGDVNPNTVDEHIAYARKGGFRFMSLYYSSLLNGGRKLGEYDRFLPSYPNGREDLVAMLKKIKQAGIIPGLHVLHTYVGMDSRYLTPKADHRINLTRHFTLAQDLSPEDTTLFVEENPTDCPEFEKARVLRFMGELIQYESYTTEPPYRFLGCQRGYNGTLPRAHERGTIGGILDISEFGAFGAYVDQRTSLQDELAEGIANLYNAGFEFIYFDGSEGVNSPFEINVSLAQWKVYRKLNPPPIFCEGAAKSHFSWHMLSGGNAFDVWPAEEFKAMIAEHPAKEAPRMQQDFTRLNFGWWSCKEDQRADILEYGTAMAAAWDCPGAFMASVHRLKEHPRADDLLETLRRWEEARATDFLTPEQKESLKDPHKEHTLLLDETGELELVRWEQIPDAFGGSPDATAFYFERKGKSCVALWHNKGQGKATVALNGASVNYLESFAAPALALQSTQKGVLLPLDRKRYLITDLPVAALKAALTAATLEE